MKTQYSPSLERNEGVNVIQDPEDVRLMLALASRGWGAKRIAKELGCSRNTVKRYLKLGGWKAYGKPSRAGKLDDLGDWIGQRFKQHNGNADVVRQELETIHGRKVSLRTVERAVAPMRKELAVQSVATVRFETAPGHQMQIDFGSKTVEVAGAPTRIFLFVATLGYSRRIYAEAFLDERQSSWFQGLEGAFRHFGGVTNEVLVDNPAALVKSHNRATREVVFNERFLAFCKYWGTVPRACAPFRARTKGKDERGVGYVKNNAIAGHTFESFEAVNSRLVHWSREVADMRVHGTTGEAPLTRFEEDEINALKEIGGRAPFLQIREFARTVANDSFVDVDTNRYSVPWALIRESVLVTVCDQMVTICHAGEQVAQHPQNPGKYQTIKQSQHFEGIFRRPKIEPQPVVPRPELLRPLHVYEVAVGGGF